MAWNNRYYFRCPLENSQRDAVLIIGWRKIRCRMVEMSIGGFAVLVPQMLPAKADLQARLEVQGLKFIVRIARQEQRDDGVLVALEQLEELVPSSETIPATPMARWATAAVWAAAVGLVLTAIYCMSATHLTGIPAFGT